MALSPADAAFFDSMGVIRPRTGPPGVRGQGGLQVAGGAPDSRPQAPSAPGIPGAPVGRPPAPQPMRPAPAPAAPAPQPTLAVAPQPQPAQQVAPAPQPATQPAIPGAPGMAPAAPTAPPSTLAAGAAPAQVQVQHHRIPSAREMKALLPGASVMTPYGPVETDPATGRSVVKLTPEGRALYGQEVAAMRVRFGPHPWADDPSAPKIDVRPGYPMYNPIANRWAD